MRRLLGWWAQILIVASVIAATADVLMGAKIYRWEFLVWAWACAIWCVQAKRAE